MNKRKRLIQLIITLSCLLCVAAASVCMVFIFTAEDTRRNNQSQQYHLMELSSNSGVVVKQNIRFEKYQSRNIPTQSQNEGISTKYPTYGTDMEFSEEERAKLFEENRLLFEGYDSMDADGNLYNGGVATGRKLYKHTAAENNYLGNVSNTEKAVVQTVTVCSTEQRNFITGLYAPAGEVVKIEISSEDLAQIGSLNVVVGRATNRNVLHNMPETLTSYDRMPIISKQYTINTTTAYVGNYLGGPIYISPSVYGKEFTVKISGAVRYTYFIYGKTTREEFEAMQDLSAPYYDFEVWNLGVRHSGPATYGNYDYDNLVNVGALWENVSCASRQVPNTSNKYVGISFVYDPYVAAGSACAYQGGNPWVNAPYNCLSLALDYQSMVTQGFWGLLHEHNHHFQNYGLAPYGEVSNNATSLISYILYTDISSSRSEDDSTLSAWNRYTDPTRSLKETISNAGQSEGQTALNIYADIIHNFGTDKFIKATQLSAGKHDVDSWYLALTQATGYDMTYYFETLLNHTVSDDAKSQVSQDLPVFVPVACLYQIGRYTNNGKTQSFVQTVRPYNIEYDKAYTLNFEDYLIVPPDFEYQITNITNPQNGTIQKISDKQYLYTPVAGLESGEIELTITLTHPTIAQQTITLVLEFVQKDPTIVSTKYVYDSMVYTSVDDAVENNFEGYTSKTSKFATSTFLNGVATNQIGVVEGKIYIPEDGDYTFCLRAGRGDNALYISFDGQNYTKAVGFTDMNNTFGLNQNQTCQYSLQKGQYVYFRQVVVASRYQSDAFTEIGWTTSQATPVTIPAKYLINNDWQYKKYTFSVKNKYPRANNISQIVSTSDISQWEILSCNMQKWDNSTGIENILDGNSDTFYHNESGNFICADNPFELIVDTHQTTMANTLVLTARKSGQENLPTSFCLYGGVVQNDLTLLGSYEDLDISNKKIQVSFDDTNIRYFKLVVTETKSNLSGTYNHYVSFAQIDIQYNFDGKLVSPDRLSYYENTFKTFEQDSTKLATFGHLLSGDGGIAFLFDGTQVAVFTKQASYCKISVEVDGVEQIVTIDKQDQISIAFLSDKLGGKHHSVTISVLEGTLNLDSIGVKN